MTKYALVTGGTACSGLATAKSLGKEGYHILLNGRREAQGAEALAALRAEGIPADLFTFDVTECKKCRRKLFTKLSGSKSLKPAFCSRVCQ